MKLCTIVGARPQFIKAATLSRVIATLPRVNEIIIHTGQHYDSNMSVQFFDELAIPTPAYSLNIGSGSHGQQTGQMLGAIEDVLLQEKPDWVLVYGDTNSTLAGALASVKLHIPVAHVEAGLRSFNRKMPEEINRIATDHVSEVLFTPTLHASQQLLKEGIAPGRISQVGDVMYDATLFYNEYNTARQTIVETLNLFRGSFVLATIHRAENTDDKDRLHSICDALIELGDSQEIVFPVHPRTRAALNQSGYYEKLQQRLTLIEPVGYLDMLALERHASLIVTDSGGVQKEAYFNQVPCITLRDETEWIELVDFGWNRLCSPAKPFSLLRMIAQLEKPAVDKSIQLYGDGSAAEKIIDYLLHFPH
ncbi:MAG: UDP-N-acetylglucosamine 2-epimerase [Legionellales bacterium RIFCSPHIGHO2_12_FULL_42_9]|nr:MAG: UDP-N-acetylglucosamine 2-epimerase [Legionellales bacterium RIFCSPHIGHO2_12_FULL_42_9]